MDYLVKTTSITIYWNLFNFISILRKYKYYAEITNTEINIFTYYLHYKNVYTNKSKNQLVLIAFRITWFNTNMIFKYKCSCIPIYRKKAELWLIQYGLLNIFLIQDYHNKIQTGLHSPLKYKYFIFSTKYKIDILE